MVNKNACFSPTGRNYLGIVIFKTMEEKQILMAHLEINHKLHTVQFLIVTKVYPI